jgi:lysozyme
MQLFACSGGSGPGEQLGSNNAAVTETPQSATCAGGSTLNGVDVSHYDGTIDWASVKAAGITFAFAKATESTNDIDAEFATNWPAMKAAGVVRGAYHFFDPSVDATAQATYCLATVGTLEAGDLPIVLDFEQLNGVAEATAVADAVTFLASVTSTTGKTAILYMSTDFLSGSYPALAPYTLWVANYGVSCPGMPSEWSTWSFWQSSDTGTVSGISDATDLDSFNGTLAQLGVITGSGSGSGSSSGSSSGGSSSGSSSGGSSGGGSSSGSSSGGHSSSGSGSGSPSGSSSGGSSSGAGGATEAPDAGGVTLGPAAPSPAPTSDSFASSSPSSSGCAVTGRPSGEAPIAPLLALGGLFFATRARSRRRRSA